MSLVTFQSDSGGENGGSKDEDELLRHDGEEDVIFKETMDKGGGNGCHGSQRRRGWSLEGLYPRPRGRTSSNSLTVIPASETPNGEEIGKGWS